LRGVSISVEPCLQVYVELMVTLGDRRIGGSTDRQG